jgi:hypothetical protein
MNDPWDVPPAPYESTDLADMIYLAVGRSLSQWEKLEFALARLSANLTGHTLPSAVAFGIYRAATIFWQRADEIEQVFRQFIIRAPDQALEADFERLICDIRRLSSRRNDIAHGIVQPCWAENETTYSEQTAIGYVLVPAGYSRDFATTGRPTYVFSSVDIDRYRNAFEEYRNRIVTFGYRLGRPPPP